MLPIIALAAISMMNPAPSSHTHQPTCATLHQDQSCCLTQTHHRLWLVNNAPVFPNYLCMPGFAPNIHNHLLTTPAPEDTTRVYSPGVSPNSGRLWKGQDVHDLAQRRQDTDNPGRAAYGASDANRDAMVHVRVGNVVVTISPWEKIADENLQNLERARQQWLKERGYVESVRSFANHNNQVAQESAHQASAVRSTTKHTAPSQLPPPSATIRLRNPHKSGGVNKHVRSKPTIHRPQHLLAEGRTIHISLPEHAKASLVARVQARGWDKPTSEDDKTTSVTTTTRTTSAQRND